MKPIKPIIDRELSRKNITKKEFAELIGMTEAGFHTMVKRNDVKISVLEEMGKVLNIPVQTFFQDDEQTKNNYSRNDEEVSNWQRKYEESQEKIKHLLNTIQLLSLGKRRGTSYALGA